MPTVDEYRAKIERAMQAGDQPAVKYFESQIAKAQQQPLPEETTPQGGNILDPLAQGVTLGFADEIGGAGSGLLSLMRGGSFGDAYEGTRDKLRERASQYQERHPYVSMGAELASGLLLPLGAARSVAQGVRLGAGAGAVTGAGKNENPDNIGTDVGLGAALGGAGGAAGSAVGGLARMIFPRRAARAQGPEFRQDIERLRAAGITTTPGERLGSTAARKAERDASAYLGSGDAIETRPMELRRQIMGRGNFDSADIEAGELSDHAIQRARANFDRDYDDILRNQTVDLGDMEPQLTAARQRFMQNSLDHEEKREIRAVFDSFIDEIARHQQTNASGTMIAATPVPGEVYKRLRSNLGKRARQLSRQDGPNASLAPVYREIQGILDDAYRTSAPPDLAARLRDADSQYRHFAFLRDVAQDPDNLNAIANRVTSSNVDPDLQALVRAYQNVILKGGAPGAGEASGNIMPPLLSMLRAAGATVSDRLPALPQSPLPPGVPTSLWGQGSGITAQQMAETGNDAKRKRKRRQKARREEADEYGSY